MAVSAFVMPLGTWLAGSFRTIWGEGGEPAPRPRRTVDESLRLVDAFEDQLERLLGFRPEWNEDGPARSATVFSIDGFARPFLRARAWAYRLTLQRLCSLEPPQIWIPADFGPVFRIAPPWNPDLEVSVASSPGLRQELDRLLEAMDADVPPEELPEWAEARQVADRLREIAGLSAAERVPVIIEG